MKKIDTLSFTDFMNRFFICRKAITKYCVSKDYEAKDARCVLLILDDISNLAEHNLHIRESFYLWMSEDRKHSTLELRSICKIVGYDYWLNLDNSNAIDVIDTNKGRF